MVLDALKTEAGELAALFCRDEEEFFRRFHALRFRYSAGEWDVILQLAQLYAAVMDGAVSRQAAVRRQKKIFCRFREGGGAL